MRRNSPYFKLILLLLLTGVLFLFLAKKTFRLQQSEPQSSSTSTPLKSTRECFVSNHKTKSILVFDASADGDASPLREITGISQPSGIAIDAQTGELYVADSASNSIAIYDKNAKGDASPRRLISGPQTNLARPEGIAINAVAGEIYVANLLSNSITVYSKTAQGDVSPIRMIKGENTNLIGPMCITYDSKHKELLIINRDHQWQHYNAVAFDESANGNTKPKRVIMTTQVSDEGEIWPEGIDVDDKRGSILITNIYQAMPDYHESYLDEYSRVGNKIVGPAKIAVADLDMFSIVFDKSSGEIFISDTMHNSITVYKRDQTGKIMQTRTIIGAATRLSNPGALAVYSQ